MQVTETISPTYDLIREMLETVRVIRNFDAGQTRSVAGQLRDVSRLLLTGEGSSRIFPAKNAVRKSLTLGLKQIIQTEGSHQASQYDLSETAVFFASNSGQTKEVCLLAKKLAEQGHDKRFGITALPNTLLESLCTETFVLSCGPEHAVAATKSVVEQALIYESLLAHLSGTDLSGRLRGLSSAVEKTLALPIDPKIVEWAGRAGTLYFAGYNDGVAEELTLKANEIARRKSDFLEGSYAAHGIEEVMQKDDVLFWIDPIESEIEKIREVLVRGVGMKVVAIADRDTPFPTIQVPSMGELNPYVFLSAGWNLLVEIGLASGLDLDKTVRARKIGNAFGV
jgi:glucosamine--fructose-6-phosphate aminotransferase (isomerizing)